MSTPYRTNLMVVATLAVLGFSVAHASLPVGEPEAYSCNFDLEPEGTLPPGWSQHHWGNGSTDWKIQDSPSGKVFAQMASASPNQHYNLAVLDALVIKDVTIEVRLRAISGIQDQGGGLLWRYQDEENHYIVRANPLENNVVLYKMQHGVRTDLPLVGAGQTYGVKVSELGHDWHTLKLRARGDEFTVYLDGQELYRVRDSSLPAAGQVGLWTKADAVSLFDDFKMEPHLASGNNESTP